MELQLNTNRLRERTGWNLFVFGGLGITHYHTRVDLKESGSIRLEDNLNDKPKFSTGYETSTAEKASFMPHFGAGIEKQLAPNISFGIMGRMTWTRTNDFDAMPNDMKGMISNLNDRYHYVSAGFKFYLGRGRADVNTSPLQDRTAPDPIPNPIGNVNTPVPQKPIVDFINPNRSPLIVSVPNFYIDANVFYVSSKNDISVKQNGNSVQNFTYNKNTDELGANVILNSGQNILCLFAIFPKEIC